METFPIQLITFLCLLVGNVVFGTLPLLFVNLIGHLGSPDQECSRRLKFATFLSYFGGGVFVSNCFLVLLPQSRKYLESQDVHSHTKSEELSGSSHKHSFPIPELIVLCSFFTAYVLQEITCFLVSRYNTTARKSSDLRVQFCSCAKRHTECSRTYKDARRNPTYFGIDNQLVESGRTSISTMTITGGPPPEIIRASQSDLLRSSIIAQTVPNYGTVTNITEPATDSVLPVLSPPVLLAEERRLSEEKITIKDQNRLFVSSILTVISLILQFLFIGISLGLTAKSPINWCCLTMSCLQNFILIFSVSSDLYGSVDFIFVALNIVLLSIVSPVGVILVMIKTDYVSEIAHVDKGIIAAVACGTLIYTTFYYGLRRKSSESVVGLTKFTSILLGACSMAALEYFVPTL